MAAPKKCSDELRERATRLAIESGCPIAHVARDLGIHKEGLRTWVRQANEILKAASVFREKELDGTPRR